MKKYKLFSALIALFLLSGCYDLDRYPMDQLSSGTFFKTQAHADQAMMGVYNAMQYDHVFGLQFSMDCLGGVAMGYDPQSYQVFQRGTYDIKEGHVANKWKFLYEGIARANVVLQNVDKCEMTPELKTRYKGEAKFMRALYYFSLLDFFGGVPLYDETLVIADSYDKMLLPRSSAEQVRAFILADLEAAITAPLPVEWPVTDKGRATLHAAIALKGKVLLYNKQYDAAAECFKQIVGNPLFKLYDNYANLFKPGGDESSEMIFAIQNMGGVGMDIGMPMTFYMGSRATFGSCWNNVMPAATFVDSYEYKDGREFKWDEVIPGYTDDDAVKAKSFIATLNDKKTAVVTYPETKPKLLAMYQERDPRMMASVILPYTGYVGWYANKTMDFEFVIPANVTDGNGLIRANNFMECYLWRKFVPEGNMNGALNNREDTPINFPLIRYADVLLMLAECYNEKDADRSKAIDLINEVRTRPGVDMPKINNGDSWMAANSKEQVFERIRHERAVELAAEGHSFSDMKRWGLLETLNDKVEKGMTGKSYYTRKVTLRDYLWPIPASEIEKNPALRPNNPGWE